MTVLRNGNNTGGTQVMDDFIYNYYDNSGGIISYSGDMPLDATNKLAYVSDAASNGNYSTDIDDETDIHNYSYDGIGNLVQDKSEDIDVITWTVNGKIKSITRTSASTKPDLEFVYDAMGNRIEKIVKPRDGTAVESQLHWTYTYYVRDAQGNVLAVYERTFADTHADDRYEDNLKLAELDIYGSKRIGVLYSDTTHARTFTDTGFTDADEEEFEPSYDAGSSPAPTNNHKRTLGKKAYEITNHLGNVLATVSDRKLAVDNYSYTAWSSGTKYKYDATLNTYYQNTSGTYQRTVSSSDGKADWYTAKKVE